MKFANELVAPSDRAPLLCGRMWKFASKWSENFLRVVSAEGPPRKNPNSLGWRLPPWAPLNGDDRPVMHRSAATLIKLVTFRHGGRICSSLAGQPHRRDPFSVPDSRSSGAQTRSAAAWRTAINVSDVRLLNSPQANSPLTARSASTHAHWQARCLPRHYQFVPSMGMAKQWNSDKH